MNEKQLTYCLIEVLFLSPILEMWYLMMLHLKTDMLQKNVKSSQAYKIQKN